MLDLVKRWIVGSDVHVDDEKSKMQKEDKRQMYSALLEEQLRSFLKDPKRTLEPLERHEQEYRQYINYREIMLCRRLRCSWCRDNRLTLEEAFVEEPESSRETIYHIRKRLHDGYNDRYIVDELEQLYETKKMQSFSSWNALQHVLKNSLWARRLTTPSESKNESDASSLVNNQFPRAVGILVTAVVVTLAVPPLRAQWKRWRFQRKSARLQHRAEKAYFTE